MGKERDADKYLGLNSDAKDISSILLDGCSGAGK